MQTRSWKGMSRRQRIAVAVLAPIELALTATAVMDLRRRPKHEVHGPKALWWLAIFVQPVGPVAYLSWGRRRST